jgi:phosphoglycolate phosphatase-like HAD superfamily hydrolase
MDGVLIDVTGSYREVVRRTVIHYLRSILGVSSIDEEFIRPVDVASIKTSGGLNNDWDLTYAIINCLAFHYFDGPNRHIKNLFLDIQKLVDDRSIVRRVEKIRDELDTTLIEKNIKERPLYQLYQQMLENGAGASPFLINRGDVKTGNIIKRIFQEYYLGAELFGAIYGEAPLLYSGEGYIDRESLIPLPSQLRSLKASYDLSVATGRPASEALHALEHFRIVDLFKAVVTEDDVVREERKGSTSLRKPHPYSLVLCARKSGYEEGDRVFYVGDMPDDMIASRRAGFIPVGFVKGKTETQLDGQGPDHGHGDYQCRRLMEKGAEKVFTGFEELTDYLKGPLEGVQ